MPLLGRQRGWWAGIAAAIIALLACYLLLYRDVGIEGDSDAEGAGAGEPLSRLTHPTRGSDSAARQGDVISAKVRSLLDVKKGELGVIQLPSIELEEKFELVDQTVVGGSELESGIVGLYSPTQLTPILEGLLRDKHRLPAKFGSTDGLDWEAIGLDSLGVEEKGQISDLTIRYRNPRSGMISQTGVSVFNGYGLLIRTGPANESAGFIIVTGSNPDPEEE